MEKLRSIIACLKPSEIHLIRDYYQLRKNQGSRRLVLFDLIVEEKVADDESASMRIFCHPPDSNFSQLKRRLKDDILNILMICPVEKSYQSENIKAEFKARKMLMQGKILLSRGVYEEGTSILRKACQLAEKYELSTVSLEIQDLLRTHIGVKKGLEVYKSYQETIDHNLEDMRMELEAKDLNHRIMIPSLYSAAETGERPEEEKLRKIKTHFDSSGSARVGFWYYLSAIRLHINNRDFERAYRLGQQLARLIDHEPAIHTVPNRAGIHLELARILIHLEQFPEAITMALEARKLFQRGMLNELYAIETLFFAHFRNRQWGEAQELIAEATHHRQYEAHELTPGKWQYFKANVAFARRDFDASLADLHLNCTLKKDRGGWFLGYRILELLNLIEKQEYDWIDSKLESFRKYLQQVNSHQVPRCKNILRLLFALSKHGFDFQATRRDEQSLISSLSQARAENYWDPMGYELVRISDWVDRSAFASR